MPSPVRQLQRAAEWALRALALGLLAWLLVRSASPRAAARVEGVRGDALGDALPRWTLSAPDSVRVALAAAPAPRDRDWLRALAGAGTAVAWTPVGEGPTALALSAERAVDPAGGATVRVAAPDGARVAIADRAGSLDTLAVEMAGGVVSARAVGPVVATMRGDRASAPLADSVRLRPLLVLGRAGWESKFAIAALEERGWRVDARIAVAPGASVTQGAPGAIDTARYAAVIALDSAAAEQATAIARYARAGGGVVLGPEAATIPALAALAPSGIGAPLRIAQPAPSPAADTLTRPVRALRPLMRLRADAIPLERRGESIVVAARRAQLGRVVLTGYDETWRWRMAGGERGPAAHRDWWGGIVSAVAHGTEVGTARRELLDAAPLAHLHDALGGPATMPGRAPAPATDPTPWLAGIALGALVVEWMSRRLRGGR